MVLIADFDYTNNKMLEGQYSVEKRALSDEELEDQDDDDYDNSNPQKKVLQSES